MQKLKILDILVSLLAQIPIHILTLHVEKYKPLLSVEDIEEILGIEKYDEEIAEKTRYFILSYPVWALCSAEGNGL